MSLVNAVLDEQGAEAWNNNVKLLEDDILKKLEPEHPLYRFWQLAREQPRELYKRHGEYRILETEGFFFSEYEEILFCEEYKDLWDNVVDFHDSPAPRTKYETPSKVQVTPSKDDKMEVEDTSDEHERNETSSIPISKCKRLIQLMLHY